MLAVLQNQVVGRGGLEGLIALGDVGMGETTMKLELKFQVFSLFVVKIPEVYNFDGVGFVGLCLFVGFVDFAAVALTEEVGFFIKIIPYPLLLFGHNFVQVKFGAGQYSVSR